MVTSSSSSRTRKTAGHPPAKPAVSKSAAAKSATSKPTAAKSAANSTQKRAAAPVAKPAAAKPATAKPATIKRATAKPAITPEQRHRMTQEAAYFLAQKNGFIGNAADYWIAAEAQLDVIFASQ